MKNVLEKLTESDLETTEEVLKQLLKKMGQDELEKWIKTSDMPEEIKRKMLQNIENIIRNFKPTFFYLNKNSNMIIDNFSYQNRKRRTFIRH